MLHRGDYFEMVNRIEIIILISLTTSITVGVTLCDAVALDDVIVKAELNVIVPEEIQSDAETVTFQLVAEGTNLDKIDKVVWNIYYYNFYEKKDVYLEPITETTLSDLVVKREGGDLSIAEMDRLCREFGATRQGNFGLTFSVFVEAFAEGKQVGKSPLYSAIFDFIAIRDLSLTVSGPDEIRPNNRQATFDLQCDGKDLVRVENVGWIFEYHTDEEGWVQDLWGGWVPVLSQNQLGIVKPIHSDLELRDEGKPLNLSLLRELAESHGSISGETKVLQMRAYVRAYLSNDDKVTLAKSDPHEFRVFAGDLLTLDLFPTRANHTSVKLKGTGTDPINIAMEQNPPAHIIVTHEQVIAPQDGRYPELEIKVELDPSQTPGLQLPSETKIVFTTRSGDQEEYFTLKLSLKKAEWLVMLYLAHDTHPPVQHHLANNLEDICDVSRDLDTPKVGIMVLADMRYRFPLDPSLFGVNDIPPNNAQLFRIIKGNLTQLGGDWGSIDMSRSTTLQRFLTECTARIPSQHLHLVLSGHGEGMLGALPDKSHRNTTMSIPQIDTALANHFFEVLSFEACLMGQIEALYDLREHAEYFTASERTIPAGLGEGFVTKTYTSGGYAWRQLLIGLHARPGISPRDYATLIVQTYRDKYSQGGSLRESATLAAIESARLTTLVTSIDALARAMLERYRANSELFNKTMANVVKRTWEANHLPYTDIKNLCQNIVNEPSGILRGLRDPAQAAITAFDNAIVANAEIIIKHPNLALFLRFIGKSDWIDPWTKIDSGYSGMTLFLWREGITGGPGNLYRLYLNRFDTTEFRTNDWRDLVEAFTRSHPTTATTINLHHPLHELYLHVYDPEGNHVGINPASENLDGLDMEIPNSYYIDFQNGTEIIILPGNTTNFEVVVDGTSMEEEEEPYTLIYQHVQNDQITQTETVTGTIQFNTNHTTPITLHQEQLQIGETNATKRVDPDSEDDSDGKDTDDTAKLPGWFTENLPFLVPLLEPIIPHTPQQLIPILPIILLGTPIIILIIAGIKAQKNRAKTSKEEGNQ